MLAYLVEPPADDRVQIQAWRAMLADKLHSTTWPVLKTGRLSSNAWLLDRENGSSVLAKIVTEAEEFHIEYQARFLSDSG